MTSQFSPTPRLLAIDDDPAIGRMLELLARNSGFEAKATTDSEEFARLAEEWQPTHVSVDLAMPGEDGLSVLRRLASMGCKARIIILSGLDDPVLGAARAMAEEDGLTVAGVLIKPFSSSKLRALLFDTSETSTVPKPSETDYKPKAHPAVSADSIAQGLNDSHFTLHYQPVINCATGTPAGFEALVRWSHPQAGLLLPQHFISVAETAGLIDRLSETIVSQGLMWFSRHFRESELFLAFNLSAHSFHGDSFIDRIAAASKSIDIAPERIVLELSDTGRVSDPTTTLNILTRLRVNGFQLSIDDFGIGYSSMSELLRLPCTTIKIDRKFVTTAKQSEEAQKIITSITDLGRRLGLRVTAEGVEDEWTLSFLATVGCAYAQGYFIGHPMEGRTAVEWFNQQEDSNGGRGSASSLRA
ncbi:EAL domain-containing response regulator [Aquibaculum sediminis]|uniref:EAL domain-containing response regulator n=1 Tax=Aquibaculum sediminis TaxID=3231907 RepID=UPI003454F8DE